MEIENEYLQKIMPTELSFEELDDPLKTIVRIFDNTGIETLKIELWEMLKACSGAQSWSFLSDPSLALDCQRQIRDLIDGLYLVLKKHEAEFGEVPSPKDVQNSAEQDEKDLDFLKSAYVVLNTFKGKVRRLSVDEVEKPHLALKEFFGIKSPANWKRTLVEWVDFALGKVSIFETFQDREPVRDYEQFEKLTEVAYLMHLKNERDYLPQEHAMEAAILEQYYGVLGVKYSSKFESVILNFLKTVPSSRALANLRKVNMDFLHYHLDAFPVNVKEIVHDVVSLIKLLEAAEEEQKQFKIKL